MIAVLYLCTKAKSQGKYGESSHKCWFNTALILSCLSQGKLNSVQVPLFTQDTDGSTGNSKVIMGRRNYCIVEHIPGTGGLQFDIRVEKEKGNGLTVRYAIRLFYSEG